MRRYEGCSKNSRTLSINLYFIYLGAIRLVSFEVFTCIPNSLLPACFLVLETLLEWFFVQYHGTSLSIFLWCSRQTVNGGHREFQLPEQTEVCSCEIWRVCKMSLFSCFARHSPLGSEECAAALSWCRIHCSPSTNGPFSSRCLSQTFHHFKIAFCVDSLATR